MIKKIVCLTLILSIVFIAASQEQAAKDSLKSGDRYYKAGYYKKAIIPYLTAIDFFKDDAELNFKLGHSYLNSPIKTNARQYLQKAYELNNKVDEDVVFELARAYHYEHDWVKIGRAHV